MGQRLTDGTVGWRWAAARAAGTSHLQRGLPCQDAFAVQACSGPAGDGLVMIVCDGAGSAKHAREGARLVARMVARHAVEYLEVSDDPPDEAIVAGWLQDVRGALSGLADARGATLRDFASTMVAAFVLPDVLVVAHVGDGACVIAEQNGSWAAASWPAGGEYAGTTYFVTDPGTPRLRLQTVERRVDAVAVFTDGLENLALEFATSSAFAPFFDPLFAPVRASTAIGCDRHLTRALRALLRSEHINARTDDDKSLILAAR